MPGKGVKGGEVDNAAGSDSSGSFAIPLGKGVALKAGHYWVSVVANCSFSGGCGQWGWGNPALRPASAMALCGRNPGGGFGLCPTWVHACGLHWRLRHSLPVRTEGQSEVIML
ncbi:MAG: hypothetical protein WDM89_21075 [Rhizomicrobium sp.]